MLSKGDRAPDFTLGADDGSAVSLAELRGRRVVVYFYPKDDTSGCTAQACGLRDDMAFFNELDVAVLGISPDPVASHVKFKQKYDLNFPLLADVDHSVAEAYGVWKQKSMYGRTYMGIERSTFIVDPDGVVEEVWRKVKAKAHADLLKDYFS